MTIQQAYLTANPMSYKHWSTLYTKTIPCFSKYKRGKMMAKAYICCYKLIHSNEWESQIENTFPTNIRDCIELFEEQRKIKPFSENEKLQIGLKIFNDMFPESSMKWEEFKEYF